MSKEGCPAAGARTPALAAASGHARVDTAKIRAGVQLILEGLGEDPSREGLRETPDRVTRFFQEFCRGPLAPAVQAPLARRFVVNYQQAVWVRDIRFVSLCEHHLLPFRGVVHVAYRPRGHAVTGLSKLARVVDAVAGRLQVQERLTEQIADALWTHLEPEGVWVVVEAEHLCMTIRGVSKPGSTTFTEAMRGCYRDPAERAALRLIRDCPKSSLN